MKLFDGADLNVIGVSDWITNESRQSALLSRFNHICIYNWIDFDTFKHESILLLPPKYLQIFKHKKVLLGVSNKWDDSKGLSDFIKLSNELDDQYVIALVGQRPKRKIDSKIVFLGPINNQKELSLLYNTAFVFLNLSISESFGLTSAEALSCGTPVISYDLTASKEIAGPGCISVKHSSFRIDDIQKAIKAIENENKDNCVARINYAHKKFDKTINLNMLLGFLMENKY